MPKEPTGSLSNLHTHHDLEETSLEETNNVSVRHWHKDAFSSNSAHTHFASRLLQDEILQLQNRQTFYEQNPQVGGEASFEQTFCNGISSERAGNSAELTQDLKEQLRPFTLTQSVDLTPWERFLVMDPNNEPSSTYGKNELALIDLQLGNTASIEPRIQAAASLAAGTRPSPGRHRCRRIKCTNHGKMVRKGLVHKEAIPNLA